MSTTTTLSQLKINVLTRAQYDAIATKEANEIYMVTNDNASLSLVAYSGSYNDLLNTPTIPTVTNDLTDTLKSHYDTAYNNNHTHSNKSVLDNITAAFTTSLNTKLSGIATGAQVNIIESISINGTSQTINNKNVNLIIPEISTILWIDEYNNTLTYNINDYCLYNNTIYKCITTIEIAEDFTSEHWIATNLLNIINQQ